MDEAVWNHSTFSANWDRLLNETIARSFFAKVLGLAEWQGLMSDEHFSVDGTLIEACASMKSFVKKDGPPPPPAGRRRTQPDGNLQRRAALERHPCLDDRSRCASVQEE